MKERRTRQLATTLEVLSASHDHPTAEQMFHRVRERLPRTSLGTVYRNLEKLRLHGDARIVRIEDGITRYDAMMSAHDHFVCEQCGAVLDIPEQPIGAAAEELTRQGFVVRAQTTALYGLCQSCSPAATTYRNPA